MHLHLTVQTDTYQEFVDNLGKVKRSVSLRKLSLYPSMTHLLWMSGTSYMVINKSMPSLDPIAEFTTRMNEKVD